jgi:hypothetical protein
MQYSPSHPWDKPGQTEPLPTKKKKKSLNKKGTNTQQRGLGAVSLPEKGGGARSLSLHKLSVSKSWKGRRADRKQVGDKLLPEIDQVVVHKAHLLSQ